MQQALAQFVRSIQSFDSKYDRGFVAAPNPNADFANFTERENQGKRLFMSPPGGGRVAVLVAPRVTGLRLLISTQTQATME